MNLFVAPHNDDEVLFGAFTLMREKPLVAIVTNSFIQYMRGDKITSEQRKEESRNAMKVLGLEEPYFVGLQDHRLYAEDVERELRLLTGYDKVYIPAVQGGNAQHDMIGEVGLRVFPDAIRYTTYTKTQLWTKGDIEVVPTEEEMALKKKALMCYESQISLPSTYPHFVAVMNKSEWLCSKEHLIHAGRNVLGLHDVDGFRPWELFKLDKDSFVVDIGAHRGKFSEYIINKYGCRVTAYEPSEICEFEHPNFNLVRKAVWDGTPINFAQEQGSKGTIFGSGEVVDTVDIAEITKEHIDLMKMNIEGAEIEVLKRANLENVDQLLVEFHLFIGHKFNPPITQKVVDEVVQHILSFGFKAKKFGIEPCYFFTKYD